MENQNNENKIIIIDAEGKERECEILLTYTSEETGKNYVVLYPIDALEGEEDEMDLFAYSFVETEDGTGELFALETDEEYEMINDVIDQFYQEQADILANEENDEE